MAWHRRGYGLRDHRLVPKAVWPKGLNLANDASQLGLMRFYPQFIASSRRRPTWATAFLNGPHVKDIAGRSAL
jgi:hypothetical protein